MQCCVQQVRASNLQCGRWQSIVLTLDSQEWIIFSWSGIAWEVIPSYFTEFVINVSNIIRWFFFFLFLFFLGNWLQTSQRHWYCPMEHLITAAWPFHVVLSDIMIINWIISRPEIHYSPLILRSLNFSQYSSASVLPLNCFFLFPERWLIFSGFHNLRFFVLILWDVTQSKPLLS